LIDKITNIRIGRRSPSDYLEEIADEIGATTIEDIFDSHLLPSGERNPLFTDDFEAFLVARSQILLDAIRAATGAGILGPASDHGTESATAG
jgi:hypothetical protein